MLGSAKMGDIRALALEKIPEKCRQNEVADQGFNFNDEFLLVPIRTILLNEKIKNDNEQQGCLFKREWRNYDFDCQLSYFLDDRIRD